MGVIADVGRGPVALDTSVFIYFIEAHPPYLPIVEPIFSAVASPRLEAVTSGVTLLETLVVPYRSGDTTLAELYEVLLTRSRGIRFNRPRSGAASRRRPSSSPCDASDTACVQLAAALGAGCTTYLTQPARSSALFASTLTR